MKRKHFRMKNAEAKSLLEKQKADGSAKQEQPGTMKIDSELRKGERMENKGLGLGLEGDGSKLGPEKNLSITDDSSKEFLVETIIGKRIIGVS